MKISRKMVSCLLVSSALVAAPAYALTFKKGQVLGADGGVYDGASPDQREALVLNSKRTGLFGSEGPRPAVPISLVVVGDESLFPSRKSRQIKGRNDGSPLWRRPIWPVTEEHIEATKEQVSDALASVDIDEAARAATEAAWEGVHGGP